ncbi:MAG: heme ABC exporter ATP-binding protein CcmA [Anaerolineae bacterium]|nr:heme ABC exporter ATP-binding protein CcmA [Anaerolineae bacterium]MDW7990595.1 heme ABC exporter ATP-binding protein CcmA [Anaerolineae bacterium]
MPEIEVRALTRTFGPHVALAGVDLTIEQGEYVTFVGPNGAGKTTLLRILATLIRPTSGTVRIAGMDPARAGPEIRRRIGFLSHRTLLYEDLTAEQNLRFYARLYGIPDVSARIDELLVQVRLTERRHDLVRTFSRGMQQRLAVARALLHRPSILLLDEPYTGLDPHAADALRTLLDELAAGGHTILLTTHDLERVSPRSRAVILHRGRVVFDSAGAPVELPELLQQYRERTAL